VEKRYGQAEFLDRLIYGYTAVTSSLDISTGPKTNMRMPTMEFPYPGMSALRASAVARDVELARLGYEKNLRELFADIELAFADALYFAEAEKLAHENLSLARDVNRAAVTMYETGMAAYSDMAMASIREDELKADAGSYAEKKNAALARLSELAGLPRDARPAALAPSPAATVQPREIILDAALARNSELLMMKKELERMDVMIEMIERNLSPDHTLGFSYFSGMNIKPRDAGMANAAAEIAAAPPAQSSGMGMNSGAMETGGGDMEMNAPGTGGAGGMVGMGSFPSLPALNVNPDYAAENAYSAELKEKRKAMAAGIEDMERRMAADVAESYANYSAARNSAASYKNTIVKSADNAYEAALAEYFSGARDFMTLMGALEMSLMKRMDLAMFERDMRMELAMLEKMAGGRTATALEGGAK
nr:TolC family protein [bacterium]